MSFVEKMISLTEDSAEKLMQCLHDGIHREQPNVVVGVQPSSIHPIFYGCYDWHSSVHSHLSLLKLIKLFPLNDVAINVKDVFHLKFTAKNVDIEMQAISAKSDDWECPYGFAWFLLLADEISSWQDPTALILRDSVCKLAEMVKEKLVLWLTVLEQPNIQGYHKNTAFSMSLLLEHAEYQNDTPLKQLLLSKVGILFPAPVQLVSEEVGTSFLSPNLSLLDTCTKLGIVGPLLIEDNMQHVLCLTPVIGDPDSQTLCHLIGLNLARSWCFSRLSQCVELQALRQTLLELAEQHIQASIPQINTGHWMGDHWTCTFFLRAILAYKDATN